MGDIVLPDAAGQPGTDFAGVLGASLLQVEASQTATVMPGVPTDLALPTQPANAGVLPDAAVPAAPVRATPRPALPDGKILPPDMPSGTIMPSDPAPHVTLMASGAPGSESVAGEPLDAEAAGSAVSQPLPHPHGGKSVDCTNAAIKRRRDAGAFERMFSLAGKWPRQRQIKARAAVN
ncbi:hypothetical protein SOQ14_14225, partial [Erythrobacter sp. T5W1-R]|uniref:hypothetical protein n=1 Tax=Erythrobacter sp. T5W1-R TaxID=3101752 RepID=UPI002AFE109E